VQQTGRQGKRQSSEARRRSGTPFSRILCGKPVSKPRHRMEGFTGEHSGPRSTL
jgi:hypothetical protein